MVLDGGNWRRMGEEEEGREGGRGTSRVMEYGNIDSKVVLLG